MATFTIVRAYQHAFHTHPNCTLAVTGGTLNALGDAVAQLSQNIVGAPHFSMPFIATHLPLARQKS
jgi:protein Mpv17